jgi:GTP-binding protein
MAVMGGRRKSHMVEFIGSFPRTVPPATLPEVAYVGRSNVGKSSALNAIVDRKKAARVSQRPGRTQAVNLFHVDGRLCFADLPGYGFARVPDAVREQWRELVEGYLFDREGLNLVVQLVDARHEAQPLDLQMMSVLKETGTDFLVLATKVDLVKRSKRAHHIARLRKALGIATDRIIPFSSKDRTGVDEVWAVLNAVVTSDGAGD